MAGSVVNTRMIRAKTCMALASSDNLPSSSSSSLWRHPPLKVKFPSYFLSSKQKATSGIQSNLARVSMGAALPVFTPENKWKLVIHRNNEYISRPVPHLFELLKNSWTRVFEILIEKAIIGCQTFTLIAVAGSLIGSVLCFLEGCFLVLKSSTGFFSIIPSRADQVQIVKYLVEALDMFLVGTALLTFGMALYIMFVGSNEMKQKRGPHGVSVSNSSNFNLMKLKQGMETRSVARAKTKVGHAILLLLQAGMMEKFTNVPLVSGLDLACFAGAVMVSAGSVFLLSRLAIPHQPSTKSSV